MDGNRNFKDVPSFGQNSPPQHTSRRADANESSAFDGCRHELSESPKAEAMAYSCQFDINKSNIF